jgi:lysophospholipase L1-like esterase
MVSVNSNLHELNPRIPVIRPGVFGEIAAAGVRRRQFDFANEILITHKTPIDYLFIGDSITHYWELQSYFSPTGKFIINRGISGDVSSYVLQRFEADVVQLRPRYVVIQVGINNYKALDTWDVNDKDIDPVEAIATAIANDIFAMVMKSKENEVLPVLASLLPTSRPEYKHDKLRNEGVRLVNSKLLQLADEHKIVFVDYHFHMTTGDGMLLREGLSDDGVHPHVRGYDIMAQVLRAELQKHGISI